MFYKSIFKELVLGVILGSQRAPHSYLSRQHPPKGVSTATIAGH